MSRKHAIDDIVAGLDAGSEAPAPAAGTRFLRRSTALGETAAGSREEKLLHWVEPERCRMWDRHNREYSLLTEGNCRDLIDGIRAQGQQEFPAIVRRLPRGDAHDFEVICGARRHFAISWLRANNYPQFRYLVEVRDLTDEEAFRLADIENRDREDISDFERARDYAEAIELYYGGRQKTMAERLEVSESWLSRYLNLARLPDAVVAAFPSLREVRELHARLLKPLLADDAARKAVLKEASRLTKQQAALRDKGAAPLPAPQVAARLKAAGAPPKPAPPSPQRFGAGLTMRRRGASALLELPDSLSRDEAETAFALFLDARDGKD